MVATVSSAAGARHVSGRWRAQARVCIRSPQSAIGASAESPPLDAVACGSNVAENTRFEQGRRMLRTARSTRRLAGLALTGVASLILMSVANHHAIQEGEGSRSWPAFLCSGNTLRRPPATSISLAAGGPDDAAVVAATAGEEAARRRLAAAAASAEGNSEGIEGSPAVKDARDDPKRYGHTKFPKLKKPPKAGFIQGYGRSFADILPRAPVEWLKLFQDKQLTQPTPIQAVAMGKLANGLPAAIIHSETGSGKTLAYLLPALLRKYEYEIENDNMASVLVVTPTRELAVQLYLLARDFTEHSVAMVAPSQQAAWHKVMGAGIIVATPVELMEAVHSLHWYESKRFFNGIQTLILDEFDAMIKPESFQGKRQFLFQDRKMWPAEGLVRRVVRHNNRTDLQVVAVSATVPQRCLKKFNSALLKDPCRRFLSVPMMLKPSLRNSHTLMGMSREEQAAILKAARANLTYKDLTKDYPALPTGIQHLYWKLNRGENDYAAAAAAALIKRRPKSALIFVCPNARQSVQLVVEDLARYGFENVMGLAREMFPHARSSGAQRKTLRKGEELASISAKRLYNIQKQTSMAGTSELKQEVREAPVCVAEENQARGLDIPGVEVVLLLGLPGSVESYMHMAGRTGRLPHPYGDCVLIGSKWQTNKVRREFYESTNFRLNAWRVLGEGYEDVRMPQEEVKTGPGYVKGVKVRRVSDGGKFSFRGQKLLDAIGM